MKQFPTTAPTFSPYSPDLKFTPPGVAPPTWTPIGGSDVPGFGYMDTAVADTERSLEISQPEVKKTKIMKSSKAKGCFTCALMRAPCKPVRPFMQKSL